MTTPDPGLHELAQGALENSWAQFGADQTVSVVVPFPADHVRAFLSAAPEESLVYYSGAPESALPTADGPTLPVTHFVGLGEAHRVRTEGPKRFALARAQIKAFYNKLRASSEAQRWARHFGGGAFSVGRPVDQHCWNDFGDATFVLPRVLYVQQGGLAQVICTAAPGELEPTLQLLQRVEKQLVSTHPPHRETLRVVDQAERPSAPEWHDLVSSITRGIKEDEFSKVVAARRLTLTLSESPDLTRVLDRLNEEAPLCTRFALRFGAKTFMGATPERLVRKVGTELTTEALAGTIASDQPAARSRLLASVKDRHEHQFVVDAIVEALEPLCDGVNYPTAPQIKELRSLLHLRTPMTAHPREDTHVLSVLDALHPTPAVGGTPKQAALEFIASHESADRGWFAAPVGWLDSAGDGEFVVALRSALFFQERVHLYAGAGIVASSTPEAELTETNLKLGGMLNALGLSQHFSS